MLKEEKLLKKSLYFVHSEVLTAVVMKSCTFLDVASCLVYSSTVKVEAICSFETSINFQRTAQRYIPEDRTIRYICHHKEEEENKEERPEY
jgi:hypothetical protein